LSGVAFRYFGYPYQRLPAHGAIGESIRSRLIGVEGMRLSVAPNLHLTGATTLAGFSFKYDIDAMLP
jgi:hypothetical protein